MARVDPDQKQGASSAGAGVAAPARRPRAWAPLAIALAGLALTALGAVALGQKAAAADRTRFETLRARIEREVARRVQVYQHGLRGTRSLFAASQAVERDEFRRLVESHDLDEEFPGCLGLGFVRRVMRDDLDAFVTRTHADGAPEFQVRQDGGHPDLMVVEFMEPAVARQAGMGLDIGREPRRRQAAERAMRTGECVLTEPIQLSSHEESAGFLMLLPVYRNGAPTETERHRCEALDGWICMPLLAPHIFQDLEEVAEGELDFEVYAAGEPCPASLIHDADGRCDALAPPPAGVRATLAQLAGREYRGLSRLEVGGRTWTLATSTTGAFHAEGRAGMWGVLAGGALLSALLALLWRAQGQALVRARAIAQSMTRDLRRLAMVAQRTTNLVIITDARRRIEWANDEFTRVTGYTLAEARGRSPGALLQCERTDKATVARMSAMLDRHGAFRGEILNRAKDGREYWLDVDIQAMRAPDGTIEGYMAVQSDITAMVEQRRALARSEARFRAMVEGAGVIVWELDAEARRFTYVSPRALRLGYTVEQWMRPGFWEERLHPQDRERATASRAELSAQGVAHRLQYRMLAADGREVWIDDFASEPDRVDGRAVLRGVLVDMTERVLSEERLVEANAALEDAQVVGRLGSWTFDVVTGQWAWSKQLARLLGADPEAPAPDYHDALALYAPHDRDRLEQAIAGAVASGEPYSLALGTARGHGGVRFVRVEGRARKDESGRVITLFGTVADVTAEVERERELDDARRQAEAASRAKSEFLANMSHEIRTPMTAIIGHAEILAADGDRAAAPAARLECVDTIRRNGQHLLSIINDILDLSRIEAGRMPVESLAADPLQVAGEVLALMRVKAGAKGLSLVLEQEGDVPVLVKTDVVRLRQIITNLVGNALKFTHAGGVRVRLGFEPAGTLRIGVIDTGIGITPEQLTRLFRPFEQADTSTTRRFGGSGLGLQISRRLAQLLGGTITVQSQPGRGSTFTATIRVEAVESAGVHAAAAKDAALLEPGARDPGPVVPAADGSTPLAGLRLLLVEDGPDNQRIIGFHLRRAGAEFEVVGDGRMALDALGVGRAAALPDPEAASPADAASADPRPAVPPPLSRPYDAVLMDMQMPEMDGYTAAGLLRTRGCRTPIIALTAHAMAGDRERCLAAGCTGYLTKPVEREELVAAILGVVGGGEVRAAA